MGTEMEETDGGERGLFEPFGDLHLSGRVARLVVFALDVDMYQSIFAVPPTSVYWGSLQTPEHRGM